MSVKPRPYQSEAVQAVFDHVRASVSPCLIELPTGAGKSVVVAELAKRLTAAAPTKTVLCLAPSKELVEQNFHFYKNVYGYQASMFCASAGGKCIRSSVIFASPMTALKSIDSIAHKGISAVIIDEAHGLTQTIKEIIERIKAYKIGDKAPNDLCRVIGMTATPYRMGTGYIYSTDCTTDTHVTYDEDKAIEPYFSKLLYKISARFLIDNGFLTPPQVGIPVDSYDTSALEVDKMGRFTKKSVDNAFSNKTTKTESIIESLVDISSDKMGVMIFASTVQHAEEICRYLPEGDYRLVTGAMKKADRERTINEFKAQRFKFIVNRDVLTTGFDAPHVDVVAVLRATESPALFQQIVGRALRLHDKKDHALILDYAENIKRHGLAKDIFTPEIRAKRATEVSGEIGVICPACNAYSEKKRRNDFSFRGLKWDSFGNFLVAGSERVSRVDSDGEPIEWEGDVLTMRVLDMSTRDEFGDFSYKEIPVPAHYSRRCGNKEALILSGKPIACEHRYSSKQCPECEHHNDIAARHCKKCNNRLVDPNEKLTDIASTSDMIEEGETVTIPCISAVYSPYVGRSGQPSLKVVYTTRIGSVTAFHTMRQKWIFNKLCFANKTTVSHIDDSYTACARWVNPPARLSIKKKCSRLEVTGVEIDS